MSIRALAVLERRFFSESQRVLDMFSVQDAGSFNHQRLHEHAREASVIRLFDAWSRFCRELVICSAYARPITLNGSAVPRAPLVGRRADVLPLLRASFPDGKPPWWEPSWGISTRAIDSAQRLRVANFSAVSAALGAVGHASDDLRRFRNFVAHRGEDTKTGVLSISRGLGIADDLPIEVMLVQPVPPAGAFLLESWIGDLRRVASAACL